MKKTTVRAGGILLSAILLCACNGNDHESRGLYEGTDVKPTEIIEKPEATPTPSDPEPEPEPEAKGEWSDYFANGEVIHNGNDTVLIGDRLYFRIFDPMAVSRTQVGSNNFLGYDNVEYGSDLMYYDYKNDKVVKVATVYGSGKLYATEEGFLIRGRDDKCNLIRPNGIEEFDYYEGVPVGVSDDGKYAAIDITGKNGCYTTRIYSGGKMIADPHDTLNGSEYVGFVGDTMIFRRADDSAIYKLYSLNPDGEVKCLGELYDYDGEFYPLFPEPYDFVTNGSDFAIACGYRDGAPRYLCASIIYTGNADSEGSVSPMVTFEDSIERSLYVDEDNNILWGEHAPDEVGMSEGKHGTVVCYTDSENYTPVSYDDYIFWPEEEDALFYNWDFVQEAFKYDNKIFMTYVDASRNPDEDYSSYMAFDLSSIRHIMFDLDDMKDGKAAIYSFDTQYSFSWDHGGFTLDDLQGEWIIDKLYVEGNEEVPADHGYSYTFVVDGDKARMIYENGNNRSETEAVLVTDDETIYKGILFAVPDDPSEQEYEVVTCYQGTIELSVRYVYDGGCIGSWYAYCHEK